MRAAACVLAAAFLGQAPTFRSRTDLVALYVSVFDQADNFVSGLPRDAFAVMEDGRTRPIEQFTNGSVPLSLVLALDTSESMKGERFAFARHAVEAFFRVQGPNDEIGVVGFNDRVFLISSWTRSFLAVDPTLATIEPHGATALYDAISDSFDALRMSSNRRQAVVAITDGNDFRQSDIREQGVLGNVAPAFTRAARLSQRLQRSEGLLYAIGVDPPPPPGTGPVRSDQRFDAAALRRLTSPTGGSTAVVHADEDVPSAAQRIAEELRHQYLIGVVPLHPADGRFHNVRVAVKACRCRVHVREGYFAEKR